MRPIPKQAVDLVAKFEGCRLEAYPDPATGGEPWTIGYGRAHGVKPSDKITQAQARAFLAEDLKEAARKLYTVIKREILDCPADAGGLTSNQYAALCSFAFNVGVGKSWTIWKRINARQFDQVPGQLALFVNANGRKMKGLVRRRAAEAELWSTDEPGTVDDDPPSSITRLAATPPTPAEPRPPQKQATFLTAAGAAAASTGAAAVAVKEQLEPLAGTSPFLDNIYAIAAVAVAVLTITAAGFAWLKSREHRN